ncbi:unnamed protein product [Laminaria digitata]
MLQSLLLGDHAGGWLPRVSLVVSPPRPPSLHVPPPILLLCRMSPLIVRCYIWCPSLACPILEISRGLRRSARVTGGFQLVLLGHLPVAQDLRYSYCVLPCVLPPPLLLLRFFMCSINPTTLLCCFLCSATPIVTTTNHS